jgi:hypothetical protein
MKRARRERERRNCQSRFMNWVAMKARNFFNACCKSSVTTGILSFRFAKSEAFSSTLLLPLESFDERQDKKAAFIDALKTTNGRRREGWVHAGSRHLLRAYFWIYLLDIPSLTSLFFFYCNCCPWWHPLYCPWNESLPKTLSHSSTQRCV